MSKIIKTGVFGIEVTLVGDGSGKIVSDLRDESDCSNAAYSSAVDALESLILAHACAGVDIAAPAYLEGVEVAVEAIAANLM
jgi:hypothetical protein